MTGNKRFTNVTWSDTDDAPELTGEFVKQADEYEGSKLNPWMPQGGCEAEPEIPSPSAVQRERTFTPAEPNSG